jgi:hypothetical protein
MAQHYLDYSSDEVHHPQPQLSMMAPPPPQTTTYVEQPRYRGFPDNGESSSSSIHTPFSAQPWHINAFSSSQPQYQATGGLNMVAPNEQLRQPQSVPAPSRNSSGRTATISQAQWLRAKDIIKKVWLDDNRSYEETKEFMSKTYNFTAS